MLSKAARREKEWLAAQSKSCIVVFVHTSTPLVESFLTGALTKQSLFALRGLSGIDYSVTAYGTNRPSHLLSLEPFKVLQMPRDTCEEL